ncbi:Tyrocidine synthase 3 [Paraburkholderia caffeinitolerans]|uniref:Tyrocidine synthase 3 n=1 Tax=Paraburkholderia caffeinitolerans TaxID=1723730 RepID=A0A6J5H056_9BURK|nr:amino acid adenylation domain-containing protein [Paraburkholderia caffeinitolerans]CAB3810214.1 Tyrocidine synthase 3 [Paraburkholderia caffeinitolerans]
MLHAFFFDSAANQPHSPALWVDGHSYTYGEIEVQVRRVSSGLASVEQAGDAKRCLLFAHRSAAAYWGVLGILDAGLAYVPLSPKMPAARIAAIIEQSGAPVMLVDGHCAAMLDEVLPLLEEPPRIFRLDEEGINPNQLSGASRLQPLPVAAYTLRRGTMSDVAYVLFTSGSTGTPKGVPITHANADAYVKGQLQLQEKYSNARYIQLCELVFDPSVHDIFVCWANGGCLYVPDTVDPLFNADFIKRHEITHWNSVPSVAGLMQQMRKLAPAAFPSLRVSMFGGEPLTRSLTLAWMRAAPNSRILHMYGPTEATIACTCFEVQRGFLEDGQNTVMPLGWALPGVELMVVDAALERVAFGQRGELLVAGPQIAGGYLVPDDAGSSRFVKKVYPGRRARRWYRTGDVASTTADHGIVFHGRLDRQVKIRGNRVELEEVENVVQACSQGTQCAVIPWRVDEAGRAAGLIAFVANVRVEPDRALQACRQRLPSYAVPERVVVVDSLPLNANGKIDRKVLAQQCISDTLADKTMDRSVRRIAERLHA